EPLFEFELRVPGERQPRNAQRDACDEKETSHRPDRGAEARSEPSKCPWQHAAEQHYDDQHSIEHAGDISKAALGQRVGNRTAICRLINDSAKCSRHVIHVRAHVTLVQSAQPQFSNGARENQNQGNDGEGRHEIRPRSGRLDTGALWQQRRRESPFFYSRAVATSVESAALAWADKNSRT